MSLSQNSILGAKIVKKTRLMHSQDNIKNTNLIKEKSSRSISRFEKLKEISKPINLKIARSRSSWRLCRNIRENIEKKIKLEKERSKASDISYSNLISNNCTQNSLINYVRDMQK